MKFLKHTLSVALGLAAICLVVAVFVAWAVAILAALFVPGSPWWLWIIVVVGAIFYISVMTYKESQ